MKLAIVGPPHSGKSCLRESLRLAMIAERPGLRPYCLDTTPDGEGAWFQAAYQKDPLLATQLKSRKRREFDWQWTIQASTWVRQCALPVTIIDTGGRIDAKLAAICRWASHAVLISGKPANLPEWRLFLEALGLPLIAEINSHRHWVDSQFTLSGEIARLVLGGLERGQDRSDDPAIRSLVRRVLALSLGQPTPG
jgi:CRISPR-associated protein Csx3